MAGSSRLPVSTGESPGLIGRRAPAVGQAAVWPRTVGETVADGLAGQMSVKERRRFSRALTTVMTIVDNTLPWIRAEIGDDRGVSLLDRLKPGELIVLFADANPDNGYDVAQVSLSHVRGRVGALPEGRGRRFEALAAAERMARDLHAPDSSRRPVEARHGDTVDLVARLASPADYERLERVGSRGELPILAIVGDTRSGLRPRGLFFTAAAGLPGHWLGLTAAAGSA